MGTETNNSTGDLQQNVTDDKNSPENQAAKKERQPTAPEDFSTLHNTHAVGTSGGDQREPDKEAPPSSDEDNPEEAPTPAKTPAPVEEPGEATKPHVKQEDPIQGPPLTTNKGKYPGSI